MDEETRRRVERVLADKLELTEHDPRWIEWFASERDRLRALLPERHIGRIEHMGSTAVPGLLAKPVVDMLVEVFSPDVARNLLAPLLEREGYDFFWRPSFGEDTPPFYAWFIRRNAQGERTHHIHMVEPHFEHWQRLAFREYLCAHPEVAAEYGRLKQQLVRKFPEDRIAYTEGKGAFIRRVTSLAMAGKNHVG